MPSFPKNLLGLAAGAALLWASPAYAGDIYVYQASNGSRLITDHPRMEPGYRLIKVYSEDDVWSQTGKPPQTAFRTRPSAFDNLIHRVARRVSVDPMLIKSVMHAESAFNPNAVSRKGASGLMQLMPGTARRYGVSSIFDPHQNVMGGARYLSYLLELFNGNLELTLAGYNAGENAVLDRGGVPPYDETRRYVKKVLHLYRQYQTEGCRRHVDSANFNGRIISCSGATPTATATASGSTPTATTAVSNVDTSPTAGNTVSSADEGGWRHIE